MDRIHRSSPRRVGLRPRIRRRSRLALPLALSLAWLGVAVASVAAAPCPASRIFKSGYSGDVTTPTFAASLDTMVVDTWSAHILFDKPTGYMAMYASSDGRFTVELRVADAIDVSGVPSGTPLDATLVLQLGGDSTQNCGGSGCGVELEGRVVVGADSLSADANQAGPGNASRTLSGTLPLPIHFVAGVPVPAQFVLRYSTGPGAGGASGQAVGSWSVVGLPPGVAALSCSGGDVTPTRVQTWGSLKTRYR